MFEIGAQTILLKGLEDFTFIFCMYKSSIVFVNDKF